MAASADERLDASNIVPRLWIGGRPPFDRDLPQFDVLVLCARELQPAQVAFQGRLIRCPVEDGALSMDEIRLVLGAARAISQALERGQQALVTCSAGLNRSALVASLALGRITRLSTDDLLNLMRLRRDPRALYNKHFQDLLRQCVGDGRSI